jgi:hypothetical protein
MFGAQHPQADISPRWTSKRKLMKPVLATALITIRVVFAVLILGDGWADTEGHGCAWLVYG